MKKICTHLGMEREFLSCIHVYRSSSGMDGLIVGSDISILLIIEIDEKNFFSLM